MGTEATERENKWQRERERLHRKEGYEGLKRGAKSCRVKKVGGKRWREKASSERRGGQEEQSEEKWERWREMDGKKRWRGVK